MWWRVPDTADLGRIEAVSQASVISIPSDPVIASYTIVIFDAWMISCQSRGLRRVMRRDQGDSQYLYTSLKMVVQLMDWSGLSPDFPCGLSATMSL